MLSEGAREQIKKKAKAGAEIELLYKIAEVRGDTDLKQFLVLNDVLAVLDGCVVVKEKTLQNLWDNRPKIIKSVDPDIHDVATKLDDWYQEFKEKLLRYEKQEKPQE